MQKLETAIKKFIDEFARKYRGTPETLLYLDIALRKYAEKIVEKDFNVEKENPQFIEDYKDAGFGGFNATYGHLYHALIDFAAYMLDVDSFDYFYSKMKR